MTILSPTFTADVVDAIADAVRAGTTLEIRGGGSKAAIGRPDRDATILDMRGFAGVIDYDPAELVLTVGAGTPLAQIEALVAGERQMLAFEPFDHGPLFGAAAGNATIGGIIGAGVAGSRRLTAGGVRDHLLGFTGVSGRGEAFVAGARVVKNVTGYDVPKVIAGSWGRLVALTQVTLKVLPAPRETATRMLTGLDPARAYVGMARAMGSQANISAAVHLPEDGGRTAFRIQGFGPSVAARCTLLEGVLADAGAVEALDQIAADALWKDVRTLAPLAGDTPLWRISIPARAMPALVDRFSPEQWIADWAGGLVWVATDMDAATIRTAAVQAEGHATLVRGPATLSSLVPTFQPRAPGLDALEARVRQAFDPASVFETGRFGGECDAH